VEYDEARTKWMEQRGYRVLRISNPEFLRHPTEIVETIWRAVESSGTPLPEIR
jgi:very-short-patch-repair endonuclease